MFVMYLNLVAAVLCASVGNPLCVLNLIVAYTIVEKVNGKQEQA